LSDLSRANFSLDFGSNFADRFFLPPSWALKAMSSSSLKYRALPIYSRREEIEELLATGGAEDLAILGFAVGEFYPEWQYAQSVCLRLAEHESALVRANACLGLACIARTKGELDKRLVKPVLLRELRTQSEFRGSVEDAIDDIDQFLKWRIGSAGSESRA
jgi:hypothetical protein